LHRCYVCCECTKALSLNQTLTTIDLSWNNIGDKGAIALAANETLTTLYLGNNCIGDEGARALAVNKILTYMLFAGNGISMEMGNTIEMQMAHNRAEETKRKLLARDNFIRHIIALAQNRGCQKGIPSLPIEIIYSIFNAETSSISESVKIGFINYLLENKDKIKPELAWLAVKESEKANRLKVFHQGDNVRLMFGAARKNEESMRAEVRPASVYSSF
jgi:hypothetical protein